MIINQKHYSVFISSTEGETLVLGLAMYGKNPKLWIVYPKPKGRMMSNHNSPEFKTIIQCTPVLTTAVKDELTQLSGELLAEGLIADDNAANLRNQFIGAAERAAQLVGYVRNRVSLDTGNYHTFIGVLEKRRNEHAGILRKLNEKFRELGESTEFIIIQM